MLGTGYRWLLLNPFIRGSLLSLAVAGFCLSCLLLAPLASPSSCAPAIAVATAKPATTKPAATVDKPAEWPRTVLRLWFLVPHLLPPHSRD
jgi:hypothetical protein